MGRYLTEAFAFKNAIADAVNVLQKSGNKYQALPTMGELDKLADDIMKHQPQGVIIDIKKDDNYKNFENEYREPFNGILGIKTTLGEVHTEDGHIYNYWSGLEKKLYESQMSDDEIDLYVLKLGELTSLIENSIMAMKSDLENLFAQPVQQIPQTIQFDDDDPARWIMSDEEKATYSRFLFVGV